jgi:hypothetical protein
MRAWFEAALRAAPHHEEDFLLQNKDSLTLRRAAKRRFEGRTKC